MAPRRKKRRRRSHAPTNHRKSHYAHEITDAFAEGWDAHEKALPGTSPSNPYRAELIHIEIEHSKRSSRQVENMKRDAELWDQGWQEQGEDAEDEKKRVL